LHLPNGERRRILIGLAAAVVVSFVASILLAPTWIEVVFHVDPDGGSGVLEILIIAASVFLAVTAPILRRHRRNRRRRRGTS